MIQLRVIDEGENKYATIEYRHIEFGMTPEGILTGQPETLNKKTKEITAVWTEWKVAPWFKRTEIAQ